MTDPMYLNLSVSLPLSLSKLPLTANRYYLLKAASVACQAASTAGFSTEAMAL